MAGNARLGGATGRMIRQSGTAAAHPILVNDTPTR
jgi:hypothetical protein